jgi:transposase
MLADSVDAVIGGDTHRDSHALQMLAPSGAAIGALTVDNDEPGFATAIDWIAATAPGPRVVVGLEGTRSYGIALARALQAAGFVVAEVERPRRADRRRGKSDPIDAELAARQLLRMRADRLSSPRADGDREALRILLSARADLTGERTRRVNRLRALLLAGDDADRRAARGRLGRAALAAVARRRPGGPGRQHAAHRAEARRLARSIAAADAELADNHRDIRGIVADMAPALLDAVGVGPVSAAQAIVSWSHPGRCRDDNAFAALAGACPVPASSGRTTRHRLNRGGDRQLNKALHQIVLTRWRCCPRTRAYIAKRRAQGRTDREIRRDLTRYLAREIYRTLERG